MRRPPRAFGGFRRALRNLRGAPFPALVGASTIAIAVFLFGAFWLAGTNLRRALAGWAGEGDAITVYARRDLDEERLRSLDARIRSMPGVERVRFLSPEDALGELRRTLGEDADLLDGVPAREVLWPTFRIGADGADREAVIALAHRLRRVEGVEDVEAETLWLERLSRVAGVGFWLAAGWGALLALAGLLVVSNGARLAALTRREEIEVLRLVGASDAFVVMPFFWEGAIQGLAGAAAGLALLGALVAALRAWLAPDPLLAALAAEARFFDARGIAALALAGAAVGALGSFGSAARFLRRIPL